MQLPRRASGTGSMRITTIANWELRLIELPRPGRAEMRSLWVELRSSPSLEALTAEAARISTRPGRRHDTFSPWPRNGTPRGVDVRPGRPAECVPSGVGSEQQEPAASVIGLQFAFLASQRLAAAKRRRMVRHRQTLMRANALEQMKTVDAQTWLGCCRLQPGRRDRALPGAPEGHRQLNAFTCSSWCLGPERATHFQ